MADESGGSFGGGTSVHWAVTSGKERAFFGLKKAKKVGAKKRWVGIDKDDRHHPDFHVIMRCPTAEEKRILLTSLDKARAELEKGADRIELLLPINTRGAGKPQIEVIWGPHVH